MDEASALDTLLSVGLLNPAQHAAAREHLAAAGVARRVYTDPGELLVWLIEQQVVEFGEFDEEQAARLDDPENLAQLQQIFATLGAAGQAGVGAGAGAGAPGGDGDGLAFWVGLCLVVLVMLVLWWVQSPSERPFSDSGVPRCDDTSTLDTVRAGARRMLVAERQKNLLLATRVSERAALSVHMQHVHEIAYFPEEKMRVCGATAVLGDERSEMGFTIAWDPELGYFVRGGQQSWLKAKYAPVPGAGEPVGEEAMTIAFRAASSRLEQQRPTVSQARNANARGWQDGDRNARLAWDVDADEPQIEQEVIPLAPCTAREDGSVTCRLLFRHYDGLMEVLGSSSDQVVEGDFDFVRDGDGWRAADNFSERFVRAVVGRRLGDLAGEDIGERIRKGPDDPPEQEGGVASP